ncbi:response regulator transcription factor [Caulobacter hibisci]|uniref:Response regulator n=1 Tax=Caulobacter hibisci TaxID=2035993 RepID=A0ABS0SU66_9CAUL|nr:response regulator [Caulobacter hibisci]MBI1683192.1 response regulator [Caulobacter hibisci]
MQASPEQQHPVLVVDDDPLVTEFVRFRLEMDGFAVEVAHNAEDALAAAIRRPPHVFLLDVGLPEINGLTLLRRLRAEKRLKDVPAIMITASAAGANVKAAMEAGAVGYVLKPFSADDLLQRVRAATKNQSRVWL